MLTTDTQPTTMGYSIGYMFTKRPYIVAPSPPGTKKPQPCPIDRYFHNLKRGHYGHNINTFSLSPMTVKVQKKIIYNVHVIHVHYMAILTLAKGLIP